MATGIRTMRDELTAKREQLHRIFEEARDGESYDYERVRSIVGGPNAVRDEVKRRTKEIDELAKKLDDAVDAARVAEDNRRALEDDRRPFAPPPHPATGDVRAVQPKSLGRLFVESAAYKGMVGMNGPASVLDIGAKEFKALFQTSAGWSPEAIREGRVELKPEATGHGGQLHSDFADQPELGEVHGRDHLQQCGGGEGRSRFISRGVAGAHGEVAVGAEDSGLSCP